MSEKNTETYYLLGYKEPEKQSKLFLVDQEGKRVFANNSSYLDEFIDAAVEIGFENIKKSIPRTLLNKVKEIYNNIVNSNYIIRFDITEFSYTEPPHSPMLELQETKH